MDDRTGGFRGLPRLVRILVVTVAVALVLVLLFGWIFPWVETNIYNPALDASFGPSGDLTR